VFEVFKRSGTRKTKSGELRKRIEEAVSEHEKMYGVKKTNKRKERKKERKSLIEKVKEIKEIRFPWWMKIVAYVLSFIFCVIALFFIILRGIDLQDAKCGRWLMAFLSEISLSVLIHEPIKVF
jgi:L-cystine uptake protein TcyP (sodium:dicarboxylate symporter family)